MLSVLSVYHTLRLSNELHPGLLVIFGTLLALYLIVFLFTLAIGGPSAVAGSALVVAFGK